VGTASASLPDPLLVLREYRQLAPWGLRDLCMVSGAILEASAIRPINAAASEHPNERTIRFYVTRGLVASPEGRGTAAVYSYRHLLQVLAIKLRQMEGGTLAAIAQELTNATGDMLERRVAAALGSGLPAPQRLPLTESAVPARGRVGRALSTWRQVEAPASQPDAPAAAMWQHVVIARGMELHLHQDHPLVRQGVRFNEIAEAVRAALASLVGE
jgi:DNA-binding transcriptional MerR regulator